MKLIVTIPAYNEEENIADVIKEIPRQIDGFDSVEVLIMNDGSTDKTVALAKEAGADYIISHEQNKGLAMTFKRALWEAVQRGADVIVNTDGDNHYDQSRIGELALPIANGEVDITIGSRKVASLEKMPFWNKHLNRIGSYVMTKWFGMPKMDVSTGFRGYSRDAAIRIQVYSLHTYVHTTLLSAVDQHLSIQEVLIKARPVSRESRLIQSIPRHMWKAGINIVRNIVLFRPLRFFGLTAVIFFAIGVVPILRWLYFFIVDDGRGHLQSLILGGVMIILSFNSLMLGMLGSSMGWSRKISEEALYFMKRRELEDQKKGHATTEQLLRSALQTESAVYQPHDEEEIKKRLQSLGYID